MRDGPRSRSHGGGDQRRAVRVPAGRRPAAPAAPVGSGERPAHGLAGFRRRDRCAGYDRGRRAPHGSRVRRSRCRDAPRRRHVGGPRGGARPPGRGKAKSGVCRTRVLRGAHPAAARGAGRASRPAERRTRCDPRRVVRGRPGAARRQRGINADALAHARAAGRDGDPARHLRVQRPRDRGPRHLCARRLRAHRSRHRGEYFRPRSGRRGRRDESARPRAARRSEPRGLRRRGGSSGGRRIADVGGARDSRSAPYVVAAGDR